MKAGRPCAFARCPRSPPRYSPPQEPSRSPRRGPPPRRRRPGPAHAARVCALPPRTGMAGCHALVRTDAAGKPQATGTPSGYAGSTAVRLQAGRRLPPAAHRRDRRRLRRPERRGRPGVYRAQYGLPACTTANGCFRKVDQTGGTSLPAHHAGWAQEISLDLDMVSAPARTATSCSSRPTAPRSPTSARPSTPPRASAARAITNSYGGADASRQRPTAATTTTPASPSRSLAATAVTAWSYPASSSTSRPSAAPPDRSRYHARLDRDRLGGAGAGCSAYNTAKPAGRVDTGCAKRADGGRLRRGRPEHRRGRLRQTATRAAGWLVFGGTSASAPIIAAVYALAGNTARLRPTPYPTQHSASLFDVTSGTNGTCRRPSGAPRGPAGTARPAWAPERRRRLLTHTR